MGVVNIKNKIFLISNTVKKTNFVLLFTRPSRAYSCSNIPSFNVIKKKLKRTPFGLWGLYKCCTSITVYISLTSVTLLCRSWEPSLMSCDQNNREKLALSTETLPLWWMMRSFPSIVEWPTFFFCTPDGNRNHFLRCDLPDKVERARDTEVIAGFAIFAKCTDRALVQGH